VLGTEGDAWHGTFVRNRISSSTWSDERVGGASVNRRWGGAVEETVKRQASVLSMAMSMSGSCKTAAFVMRLAARAHRDDIRLQSDQLIVHQQRDAPAPCFALEMQHPRCSKKTMSFVPPQSCGQNRCVAARVAVGVAALAAFPKTLAAFCAL
jgi:hypothetical protein